MSNAHEEQAKRLSGAADALSKLEDYELAELLWWELDRRRLDEHGNPTSPPGRYEAAAKSVGALLGCIVDGEEKQIERLDAVARGARLNVKDQDTRNKIRELAPCVDVFARKEITDENSLMLAKTLERLSGKSVDHIMVSAALGRESRNGRIADIVIGLGIIPLGGHNGRSRQDVLRNVAQALDED